MTKTIMIAAAAVLGAGLLSQAPARAESFQAQFQLGAQQATDFSARRYRRDRRAYRGYYPGYRFGRAYASDPSVGYYPTLRRYQRAGRCVIDLGYGRFQLCN